MPDSLNPLISDRPRKNRTFNRVCHWYNEVDSTNRVAFERGIAGGEEGEVFIAEAQTKGRGRLGRSWFSPRGLNVYLSLLLRPRIRPEEAPGINLVAGAVIAKVLKELYGLSPLIKWPNDVLVNGKKLAGVLGEMQARREIVEFVVLGAGVNLNVPKRMMPKDVQEKATSVLAETRAPCDRAEFVREYLASMESHYRLFLSRGLAPFLSFLRNHSFMTGRNVEVEATGKVVCGTVVGMSAHGALLIDSGTGQVEEIKSGTVHRFLDE